MQIKIAHAMIYLSIYLIPFYLYLFIDLSVNLYTYLSHSIHIYLSIYLCFINIKTHLI